MFNILYNQIVYCLCMTAKIAKGLHFSILIRQKLPLPAVVSTVNESFKKNNVMTI